MISKEGHHNPPTCADIPLQEAVSLGARDIYVIPTAPLQVERLLAQEWWRETGNELIVHIAAPPSVHIPLVTFAAPHCWSSSFTPVRSLGSN
jgi:hypothetical protein